MAVQVLNEQRRLVTLLNPAEKCRKYASQLHTKTAMTNEFKRKKDKNGKNIVLTDTQLAYRAGYLAHASDSQKAFRAKNPDYKRKTKNRHSR